jgi:hypothetical protein
MGDDAIRAMFQQGFSAFPNHPVTPGENWTGQFQMTNPMFGKTTSTTSTLKSVERIDGMSLVICAGGGRLTHTTRLRPSRYDSRPDGLALFDTETQQVLMYR